MELSVENASLGEILQALSGRFAMTYRLPSNVGRTFTGSYSGSLRQVLSRVLQGNDYIVREAAGGLEVVILAPAVTTNKAIATIESKGPVIVVPTPVISSGATKPAVAAAPPPPLSSFLAGAQAVSADSTEP